MVVRAAAHASAPSTLPTYTAPSQHLRDADVDFLSAAARSAAGPGADAADLARLTVALRTRLRKLWNRVTDPGCARVAIDPDDAAPAPGPPQGAVAPPRVAGITDAADAGAVRLAVAAAAYAHFLALRSACPDRGQAYRTGQHLRGVDAALATRAAAEVCGVASTAAALRAVSVSVVDVEREARAVIRRRLIKPGQAEARGEFELTAAVAARAAVAAGARSPGDGGGGRGGGDDDTDSSSSDADTSATPPPRPHRTAAAPPTRKKRPPPSALDEGGRLAVKRAAGRGAPLSAAAAAARVAALTPTSVAWSPAVADGDGFISILLLGTADGCVWAWRVDHPRPHAAGGAPPGALALALVGRTRAFGSQPVTALAFARPAPDAPATAPLIAIAGGGSGGVVALAWSQSDARSAHSAAARGPPPPALSRAGRLLPADGRAVTALDVRLDAGVADEDGGGASAPWLLRVAAGKAGGALAAWPALRGAGPDTRSVASAIAAAPASPAWAIVPTAATCVGAAWAPRGCAIVAGWADGALRAWRPSRGVLASAGPPLPGPPAPDGGALSLHCVVASPHGLLVAAIRCVPPHAAPEGGGGAGGGAGAGAKAVAAASMTRTRVEAWCLAPSASVATPVSEGRGVAAMVSALRTRHDGAAAGVAEAAAVLRDAPAGMRDAVLTALEAPLEAAVRGGGRAGAATR